MTTRPRKILIEALAAHEIFRRLGFPADDIFFKPMKDGRLLAVLRSGGKEFVADLGVSDVPVPEFTDAWVAAIEWWKKDGREPERLADFEDTDIRKNAVSLIASLAANGFKFKKSYS